PRPCSACPASLSDFPTIRVQRWIDRFLPKGHLAYSDTSRRTDTSQAPMSMRASMIDESEHSATPQEAVNYLVDRVEDFANTALASPKFAEDESPNPTLTPRFEEAFRYALDLHRNQRRKGTN